MLERFDDLIEMKNKIKAELNEISLKFSKNPSKRISKKTS
jgi:hypothetical protein